MILGSTPPTIDPRDEAFLREVDEAYREDRLKQFFQRYWRLVLLLVGGGLALVGGVLWWQAHQNRQADDLSERFMGVLNQIESGSGSEAQEALAGLGQSDNASYRSLAALTEAGVSMAGDAPDKAAEQLKAVAEDARAPQPLRDVAAVKYVAVQFDQLPPEEVLSRLQPYLEPDNPWFPVAGELAALAQMKAGNSAEAGKLFRQVANEPSALPSIRSRAEQMAASLGEDMTALAVERETAIAEAAGTAPAAEGVPAAGDTPAAAGGEPR